MAKEELKFDKKQIVTSEKYKLRVDVLNAILEEDKLYSIKEIDKMIENFMKSEVK